jgi:hypothetical protein
MQVSLDAIDWEQLTSFGTMEKFLGWFYELDDENEFRKISCYGNGWSSDSAIEYFQVAEVLQHLTTIANAQTVEHLNNGIRLLIAENSHIDEFKTGDSSDGCYWISASPSSVQKLKSHVDALDLNQCIALLKARPLSDAKIMAELDGMFVPFIKQHSKMIDLAVANNYGLLGHCG